MKQTSLIILFLLAVGLSACSGPPEPDVSNISFYNKGSAETLNDTPVAPSNSPVANPTSPKGSMKTISDFESVVATQATITTTKGDITISLFRDQAPLTTANFLDLVKKDFYNGIVFHRVIPNFMAQVGDPLTKDAAKEAMWGTGGPGYAIADEFGSGLTHDAEGVVSMANSGPNSGGSQFFITYGATPWLDGKHAIFGKVTQGLDVLKQIEVGDKIVSIAYQ